MTLVLIGLIATSFWPSNKDDFQLPKKVDFNQHIRPILSQNCFICHGNDPESREAGLRLDTEEGAKAILESGNRAIVSGNPSRSTIVSRISSNEADFRMPPPESKKILSGQEKAMIKKWIRQGAEYKPHWSLVHPKKSLNPADRTLTNTEIIDKYVHQKIEEKGLVRSPGASRSALIRRVAYLVTGLPPTVDELQSFLSDSSVQAYVSMLDYYLSADAMGERWARHWMDLVRYGESMGHEGDYNISHAYEYRDYLIRAFNQDVPYDLFVKEHLAGDMLDEPRYHPTDHFNESQIGTGYFFLGEGKHSPVDIKEEESDKIDNMIDVTSKTFLGLTVACARCHDHKFDPIPTTDYYSMYGMIESSRLVPIAARKPSNQQDLIDELRTAKSYIRESIADQLMIQLEKEHERNELVQLTDYLLKSGASILPDSSMNILADFRSGERTGWYEEGIAFGGHASRGELLIDPETLEMDGLITDFASSRTLSGGVQGVLHSPNFTIEHDSIVVRARGNNGLIRVVIENFQVIQGPLWDFLEARVNGDEWKDYKLEMTLAKGRKAYIQFLPGDFIEHIYQIEPDDYIDVQYAVAFSGDHPIGSGSLRHPGQGVQQADITEVINSWKKGSASSSEAAIVSNLLFSNGRRIDIAPQNEHLSQYLNLSKELFDPTHFIGFTEGDAVFSPVFIRGGHENLSEYRTDHRFLEMFDNEMAHFPSGGSGRLAWAESLVHPDNPLTSRVIVNRIWHHIFGRGIVSTVDNFGLQGALPSHPELLDVLAVRFVQEGWSIKTLIRQIMLSETFQRSTVIMDENNELDPDNAYLSHFPIRRLEAEAIRDGILTVSGCLDRQMYGEGVPVHLSSFMTGRGRPKVSGPMDSYGRRSIYRTVRRNFIPEMMLAFDMPIPFSTFGKRNTTNVPAQSLTMLNDPFIHEQATYWAERVISQKDQRDEEKIEQIYLTAFSRKPNTEELDTGIQFLESRFSEIAGNKDDPFTKMSVWKQYCHAVMNFKEFIHLL